MEVLRSPLQEQLHRIRWWMVVLVNAGFLLFTVVTVLLGPTAITWHELFYGTHRTRTFAALVTLLGLVSVVLWPQRLKTIYLPYLTLLLLVVVLEVRATVEGQVMPFHPALWLSVNMSVLFLVFGVRLGLRAFAVIMVTILLALWSKSALITGYLRVDWIDTLIVMLVAGATSFSLMLMIERNLLVNERALMDLRSARTDAVTGVPGRAIMEERLEEFIQASHKNGQPLAVIMADLDHFKSVNDVHGHKVGDDVLREFAERAGRVALAQQGLVGRWGGEEFMVILPNSSYQQAFTLAEKLRSAVNEQPFLTDVKVTASFGVASVQDDASTADRLYLLADQALYEAKRTGRNKVA